MWLRQNDQERQVIKEDFCTNRWVADLDLCLTRTRLKTSKTGFLIQALYARQLTFELHHEKPILGFFTRSNTSVACTATEDG